MISLKNITKVYQTNKIETLALDNINIDIKKGEFVSVMGPSGCGKSTLLNIIGLLDEPSEGEINLANKQLVDAKDKHLASFRNENIGFIFQNFHLIDELDILDNVELPLLYRNISGKERRRRAKEALEKVGLSHRMEHYPGQLSGGQCQRVAIARAIVGEPNIILADEPTGNLDSKMGDEIMQILTDLNSQLNSTIVMVTHDIAKAEKTQRIIRLFDGRQIN